MAGWIALHVDVADDAADAVTNFLFEAGAGAVLTDAAGPGRVRLEAHLPAVTHTDVRARLERYLASLAGVLPAAAGTRVTSADVPAVDWEATFRHHHRPVAIGRRLLVAPPWDVPPAPGREVLVIEPGMAFGTGQHATTRGCLEEIEAAIATRRVRSGLDVGTGSGVLAAAMARLGVPRVVALDDDRAVVPLARANLRANRAARVLLLTGRAEAVRGTFDLVVANLLLDALVAAAPTLAARVAAGGWLVLSGLLDTQVDAVVAAYPGWHVAATRAEDAWRTLRLVRAG